MLTHETQLTVIAFRDDKYHGDIDLRAEGVNDKSLRDLYHRHHGWIAVSEYRIENWKVIDGDDVTLAHE